MQISLAPLRGAPVTWGLLSQTLAQTSGKSRQEDEDDSPGGEKPPQVEATQPPDDEPAGVEQVLQSSEQEDDDGDHDDRCLGGAGLHPGDEPDDEDDGNDDNDGDNGVVCRRLTAQFGVGSPEGCRDAIDGDEQRHRDDSPGGQEITVHGLTFRSGAPAAPSWL